MIEMAQNGNFSCFDQNLSKVSITPFVWSLDPIVSTDTATMLIITIVIILVMVIGLPWNILLIASIIKKRLYKNQPTTILLLNLAVSDLMVCVMVIPLNIVTQIAGEFVFGKSDSVRCRVCQTGVIFVTLSFVSLNILALMSLDRFVYIKAPLRYSRWITSTRTIIAAVLAWALSLTVAFPSLFGFGEMRFSTVVGICTLAFSGSTPLTKNSNYLIFVAFFVLIPVVILVVTNVWALCIIQKKLRNKSKRLEEDKKNNRKSFHKKMKREHTGMQLKMVKIYSAIILANIITWLPTVGRIIAGVVAEQDEFTPAVRITGSIAYIALVLQSVVHPVLQANLIGDVRKSMTALCAKINPRRLSESRAELSFSLSRKSNVSPSGCAKWNVIWKLCACSYLNGILTEGNTESENNQENIEIESQSPQV